MISFDIPYFEMNYLSRRHYTWSENNTLVMSYGKYYEYKSWIGLANTSQVNFHEVPHYVFLGTMAGVACARAINWKPRYREIPDDPMIPPNKWKAIKKPKYSQFDAKCWENEYCHKNTLVTTRPEHLNVRHSLLPEYLKSNIRKLKKSEVLVHSYSSNTTRVFNVGKSIELVTISPDESLVAVLTRKQIFFFDLE